MPPPTWLTEALANRAYDSECSAAARELAAREYLRELGRRGVILSNDEEASKKRAEIYLVSAGREHPDLNRYEDVLQGGRYINANWVYELHGGVRWIAQQAPMKNPTDTIYDFLSMLLQSNLDSASGERIHTVIQLSPYKEGSTTKACHYIPKPHQTAAIYESGKPSAGPRILITASRREEIEHARCIDHTVTIVQYASNMGPPSRGPHTFNHIHYTGWADKGVPADRASLLAFINYVHERNRRYGTRPEMVAGCSAGVGRTGTFLALCSLLRANGLISGEPDSLSSAQAENQVSIPSALDPPKNGFDDVMKEIDSLREQRPMMVETEEQHKLIYETLKDAFEFEDAGVEPRAGVVLKPTNIIGKLFSK
jgi:protein-tyrosine phosphatase